MTDDFLFSKELRERMAKFNNMDVKELIKLPEFYEELLEHAGFDQKKKNEMWKKVGRPDLMKDENTETQNFKE